MEKHLYFVYDMIFGQWEIIMTVFDILNFFFCAEIYVAYAVSKQYYRENWPLH